MKREFIQSPAFSQLVDTHRMAENCQFLETDIMNGAGATIGGTGGLQKIRWRRQGEGKRGGWRVVFADYPRLGITVLVVAFRKNVQENLTARQKAVLKDEKAALDREMERLHGYQAYE